MFCYLQYFHALCKTVPYCSDIIGIVDLELGVFLYCTILLLQVLIFRVHCSLT